MMPYAIGALADPGGWGLHPHRRTHNAPKLAILRSKIEKKNYGEGAQTHPRGEGYPLPTPHPTNDRNKPADRKLKNYMFTSK